MRTFVVSGLGVLVLGCGDAGPAGPTGQVSLQVAPLKLAGIAYACYDVRVSSKGEVVWQAGDPTTTHAGKAQGGTDSGGVGALPGTPQQGDAPANDPPANDPPAGDPDKATLCSDSFGNGAGGGISYVGTCDAQVDADPRAGTQNVVTLWVDGLYGDDDVDVGDWQSPCPATGCQLVVDCVEDHDSPAEFDLTVMRRAQQGFFDVAVNFADVFCSAKFDTCYLDASGAPKDPIELLSGDDPGGRDWTGVYGFACTGGPGKGVATELMYSAVHVNCGGVSFALDPRHDAGNAHAKDAAGDSVRYGVYRGAEQLDCGVDEHGVTLACNKLYWNLAIDLDDLAPLGACALSLTTTATDANGAGQAFAAGVPVDAAMAYPYINLDTMLTTANGPVCQHNELDDPKHATNLTTHYEGTIVGTTEQTVMCSELDATEAASGAAPSPTGGCDDDGAHDPHDIDDGFDGATEPSAAVWQVTGGVGGGVFSSAVCSVVKSQAIRTDENAPFSWNAVTTTLDFYGTSDDMLNVTTFVNPASPSTAPGVQGVVGGDGEATLSLTEYRPFGTSIGLVSETIPLPGGTSHHYRLTLHVDKAQLLAETKLYRAVETDPDNWLLQEGARSTASTAGAPEMFASLQRVGFYLGGNDFHGVDHFACADRFTAVFQ